MTKRLLLLAAILAIPTIGTTNLAVAGVPIPGCLPCPPEPPPVAGVELPAEAR
ncbi:MAG: hypothetical protein IPP47_16750 [Bryobacterales bacterium]|nr:hypothetical protein [Bryobacterales bacterium]